MRRKTFKPSVILDCRYLTGDREVRIYLRPMPEPRRKRCLSIRAKLRIKSACRYALLCGETVAIMLPISIIVLDLAYASRGYWAVGGEFLLLGFVAFGIFKVLNFIF